MNRLALALVLLLLSVNFVPVQATVGETITNYYSPCANGTDGTVSTWHSATQNGKPPLDPERRTYDFRCQDKQIYAPTGGTIYGATPRFGGVILLWDAHNDACVTFLGMHEIEVEPGQEVELGTYLGKYGHAFHLSALNIDCQTANWYDYAARAYERPVIFVDLGVELAPDIVKTAPYKFVSQNPGGADNS